MKCIICNDEIKSEDVSYANPNKPMHWGCYLTTTEGKLMEKTKIELALNPYRYVTEQIIKKPKRYCWFHRNDCNEKIEAVAYWYRKDGGSYHACEECVERYGKTRKNHWYGERKKINNPNIIEPFEENCEHDNYKLNAFTDFDESGSFDIIACKKCGGQRKRRFGGI